MLNWVRICYLMFAHGFGCCMKRLVFDVIVVVSHQNQKMDSNLMLCL